MDLGLLKFRQTALLSFGPEANAAPGPRAPGSTGSLVGRGATDPRQFPAVDAAFRVISNDARQPGVDHRGHAIDRQLVSATFVLRMTLRR